MMLTVCAIFHPINGSIIKKWNNLKKVEQLRNFLRQHNHSQIKFLCTLIIQPRDPCYNMPSNSLVFGKRGINNSVIVPLDEIAEIKDPHRATRGLGVSFLSRFNVKITMKLCESVCCSKWQHSYKCNNLGNCFVNNLW